MEGYVPSLEHYEQERFCIMEMDVWPQKLQRVFEKSESGPIRNLRNRFVLREGGGDEDTKLLGC